MLTKQMTIEVSKPNRDGRLAACAFIGLLAVTGCEGSTPPGGETQPTVATPPTPDPASAATKAAEWCQNDRDPAAVRQREDPAPTPNAHFRASAHEKEHLRAQDPTAIQAAAPPPRPADPRLLERQAQYLKELEVLRVKLAGADPAVFETERIALKRQVLGYPAVARPTP